MQPEKVKRQAAINYLQETQRGVDPEVLEDIGISMPEVQVAAQALHTVPNAAKPPLGRDKLSTAGKRTADQPSSAETRAALLRTGYSEAEVDRLMHR